MMRPYFPEWIEVDFHAVRTRRSSAQGNGQRDEAQAGSKSFEPRQYILLDVA